ncbi:recombinase family protein [Streptomyces sp. E-08]|uniref:recombinase family protein n=1 Tax=Streptomyces sp. E-08 TaxID=3404047 RepID=UPI003CFAAB96
MAVYARQFKARPDSSEASPEAQVAAGEALAASRGWEVVHTFKDVGRSGWDPHVIRPSFEDLMSAVRAGEVDVVVVNELSRLTRKGAHNALEIDTGARRSRATRHREADGFHQEAACVERARSIGSGARYRPGSLGISAAEFRVRLPGWARTTTSSPSPNGKRRRA